MFAWKVVKTFVDTLLENKTNDMATNFGIFIRSSKDLNDIIGACSNLIQNSKSGGKIQSVIPDSKYGGVKVYLNGDGIVKELIGKQFLYETGDLSTIHPLITHLTVQDAIFCTPEEKFMEDLRKIIEDTLGPVLKVSKVSILKDFPEIGNGNWRIILNVPEIEDLSIYKENGLPDKLTIKIPGVHNRSKVTFYCTKCEKDGHSQWRCSKSIKQEVKLASLCETVHGTPGKSTSGFFIRDREEGSKKQDATPKNKPSLKRKNIKEFESKIGKEEVRNYCGSHSKGSVIKKEVAKPISSDWSSVVKSLLYSVRDDEETNSKKVRIDDDSRSKNLAKASSTTSDADCLEPLFGTSPSIASNNRPLFQSGRELLTKNCIDDSVSTSNQPEPAVDTIKPELPLTDESVTPRKRKKPAQGIPIVIPDRIQKIISDIEGGVLNVVQLTAFFNHVKKKAKPCKIAEVYTSDVAGLKNQLVEIKRRYYLTPECCTNEEIQFMKWFVNILNRFDGVVYTKKKKAST